MESSSVQGDFYGKFLHLLYIAAFLNLFLPQHPFWSRLSNPAPPTIG